MTWWDRWTEVVTWAAGHRWAFAVNVALTLAWLASGFLMSWSQSWNFVANTSTTVLTYLMVFIIQHSQNKNDQATQLKLDELIRALSGPRSELAGVDRQGEQAIKELRDER